MDAQKLLEIADFWPAKTLLTATELGIFSALKQPSKAKRVAAKIKADKAATTRLLDALVGMGILDKTGNKYSLEASLRELLLPGPECVVPMLLHRATLWDSWSGLADVVQFGQAEEEGPWQEERPLKELKSFIGAMRVIGSQGATQAANALDLSAAGTLLDIGGGPGVYAAHFAKQYPGLEVTILDLPRVCKIAKSNLAGSPEANRVSFIKANVLNVDIEELAVASGMGFDVIFMSNLIHSMGPEDVQLLFAKCASWVKPGGKIVVKDFFLDDSRTGPPKAAVFGINMLACTPRGQCYTWTEIEAWLGVMVELRGMKPKMSRIKLEDGIDGLVIADIPSN